MSNHVWFLLRKKLIQVSPQKKVTSSSHVISREIIDSEMGNCFVREQNSSSPIPNRDLVERFLLRIGLVSGLSVIPIILAVESFSDFLRCFTSLIRIELADDFLQLGGHACKFLSGTLTVACPFCRTLGGLGDRSDVLRFPAKLQ